MNPKTIHPKRVKRFKAKISKASIAIETQFPKKSRKLDADELADEFLFTKRPDEIITGDENTMEHPFFDFF